MDRKSHGTEAPREMRFEGLALSPGVVHGRVCLFNERRHSNLPIYRVEGQGTELEVSRVTGAVQTAKGRLEALIRDVRHRVGKTQSEIFAVQKLILEDASLVERMHEDIRRNNVNAEASVMRIIDAYETRLLEVDDAYLKERASDLGEVKRRLLDVLQNLTPSLQCVADKTCQRGKNRVVVARELTPGLTVELDTRRTLAFVTERGGRGAHAAILAQALGIPAVSGIARIHSLISCGTEILVDGNTGTVIVWPAQETLAAYPGLKAAGPSERGIRAVPPVGAVKVWANISQASDAADALEAEAEGIGLYRTEFEMFSAGKWLSEDEQYGLYLDVVRSMGERPVTFRLLDVGGDKSAPFFNPEPEENPYLGLRGARFLLANPALLRDQARALARVAAEREVRVLYPMVIDLEQFLKLKNMFVEATQGLGGGAGLRHGVMFEVPSACLQAEQIMQFADFASVGSNDLVQYLFAVDRNNERVSYDYNADRPVFWELLERIARSCRAAGKPLSLCGQLAENPVFLKKLIALGIDTVSVSPRNIGLLRASAQE